MFRYEWVLCMHFAPYFGKRRLGLHTLMSSLIVRFGSPCLPHPIRNSEWPILWRFWRRRHVGDFGERLERIDASGPASSWASSPAASPPAASPPVRGLHGQQSNRATEQETSSAKDRDESK